MILTMDQYRDAEDSYQGFCTYCGEFTRDGTEPDAEGYDCPQCERDTVMGAMNAMMEGVIEVTE